MKLCTICSICKTEVAIDIDKKVLSELNESAKEAEANEKALINLFHQLRKKGLNFSKINKS